MRTTMQEYLLGNPQKVRKDGLAVRAPRRSKVDNGLHMVARRERRMQVLNLSLWVNTWVPPHA